MRRRLLGALGAGLALAAPLAGRVPAEAAPAPRIVSLAPSHTETLFALGAGPSVVGVSDFCNAPAAAKAKPKVGTLLGLSVERLVSLKPTAIVTVEGANPAAEQAAARAHARLVKLGASRLADLHTNIRVLGELSGRRAEAKALSARLRAEIAAVKPAVPARSVFYMVWDTPLQTAGRGSYLNDLLEQAGGRNIAAASPVAYPLFSAEALLAADPDLLLAAEHEKRGLQALAKRFPRLKAVRAGAVKTLSDDLVSRPGPRVALALRELKAAIEAAPAR